MRAGQQPLISTELKQEDMNTHWAARTDFISPPLPLLFHPFFFFFTSLKEQTVQRKELTTQFSMILLEIHEGQYAFII